MPILQWVGIKSKISGFQKNTKIDHGLVISVQQGHVLQLSHECQYVAQLLISQTGQTMLTHGGHWHSIPHICHKYHKWDMWRKMCHVEKFQIYMHDRCGEIWNFSTWRVISNFTTVHDICGEICGVLSQFMKLFCVTKSHQHHAIDVCNYMND